MPLKGQTMTLYEKIENDMKDALKRKDAVRLSVLRMLVAAVKNLEIDKKLKAAGEADVVQIIQKHIKQHKESIEQFKAGNRQDLVDKESAELVILEKYMPSQLSESQIRDIIKAAIAETGATTKAEMGKVMKIVMEKTKGQADGKIVNQLVLGMLK